MRQRILKPLPPPKATPPNTAPTYLAELRAKFQAEKDRKLQAKLDRRQARFARFRNINAQQARTHFARELLKAGRVQDK